MFNYTTTSIVVLGLLTLLLSDAIDDDEFNCLWPWPYRDCDCGEDECICLMVECDCDCDCGVDGSTLFLLFKKAHVDGIVAAILLLLVDELPVDIYPSSNIVGDDDDLLLLFLCVLDDDVDAGVWCIVIGDDLLFWLE